MTTDPRFPNRPTHPDFAALSRLIIAHDELVSSKENAEMTFDEFIGLYADPQSVEYMAHQRALRLWYERDRLPITTATFGAAWIDGFCLGVAFAKAGGGPR